jgi:hypothetical protein
VNVSARAQRVARGAGNLFASCGTKPNHAACATGQALAPAPATGVTHGHQPACVAAIDRREV